MGRKVDAETKERAARLALRRVANGQSLWAAAEEVRSELGVSRAAVIRWAKQAAVDAGDADGADSELRAELKEAQAENKRLREQNEILRAASIFFAGELAPPRVLRTVPAGGAPPESKNPGVHRRAESLRICSRVNLCHPHVSGVPYCCENIPVLAGTETPREKSAGRCVFRKHYSNGICPSRWEASSREYVWQTQGARFDAPTWLPRRL